MENVILCASHIYNSNIFPEWSGQCVQDSQSKRLLPTSLSVGSLTPAKCMEACAVEGFSCAGVQYTFQCWCGHDVPPADLIIDISECNLACPGDDNQTCGGLPNKMNVYQIKQINPVDGGWSDWHDWSECSQSCGGGTETRWRLCDSPAQAHGGRECDGDHSQERQCKCKLIRYS